MLRQYLILSKSMSKAQLKQLTKPSKATLDFDFVSFHGQRDELVAKHALQCTAGS